MTTRVTSANLASEVAEASIREMVAALGPLGRAPLLSVAFAALFGVPSRRLGLALARFDGDVGDRGIACASRATLRRWNARLEVRGPSIPERGGILVVANHPGAYDALALFAAIGRTETAVVAHDRSFLRSLPNLARDHLIFADEGGGATRSRAAALRRSLRALRGGTALLHFGAGAIEPDVAFSGVEEPVLERWLPGTGVLVGAALELGVPVVPAFVAGVHSPRAKSLPLVRFAEKRGVTTLAPLVQATLPGFHDVAITVTFGAPLVRGDAAADFTECIRLAVRNLAQRR